MNDSRDPLDLLRAAAPEHDRIEPGDDAVADAMLHDILATPLVPARQRRRRRRGVVVAALAVATASAGTVAAIVLSRDKPDTLTSVACWSEAEVQPGEVIVVPWDGSDPIEACIPIWENDRFETFDPNGAPPLVACVNTTGGLVVVPGETEACEALGLTPYNDTPDSAVDRARAAVEEIESTVTEAACLSPSEAVATIEEILARRQLSDWTIVEPDTATPDTACMTVGIDTATRTVFIVPGIESSE